jgi:phospholipid/cholesterol/gamma-HCH transport system substrate-binding protein
MEPDKHYFIEGLFVIVLSVAAAFFAVWLSRTGNDDDVLYRIHFDESVSGLALGEPVKFVGVDVGTVKSMSIDTTDTHWVQVDVKLRKDAPVKTDTKATLKTKGITGVSFIELSGGSADAQMLVAATPAGEVPEIPAEKSALTTVLEQLPKVIAKFSAIEDKAKKVVSDAGAVTAEVKENPSLLLRGRKDSDKKKVDDKKDSEKAGGKK